MRSLLRRATNWYQPEGEFASVKGAETGVHANARKSEAREKNGLARFARQQVSHAAPKTFRVIRLFAYSREIFFR